MIRRLGKRLSMDGCAQATRCGSMRTRIRSKLQGCKYLPSKSRTRSWRNPTSSLLM
ncbi:hypothetical protein BDR03DRAFT_1041219 [Suillus americanus]|nr:hypothetical protein BDR03DRAFT_1041219 [Suillus americanus]